MSDLIFKTKYSWFSVFWRITFVGSINIYVGIPLGFDSIPSLIYSAALIGYFISLLCQVYSIELYTDRMYVKYPFNIREYIYYYSEISILYIDHHKSVLQIPSICVENEQGKRRTHSYLYLHKSSMNLLSMKLKYFKVDVRDSYFNKKTY